MTFFRKSDGVLLNQKNVRRHPEFHCELVALIFLTYIKLIACDLLDMIDSKLAKRKGPRIKRNCA